MPANYSHRGKTSGILSVLRCNLPVQCQTPWALLQSLSHVLWLRQWKNWWRTCDKTLATCAPFLLVLDALRVVFSLLSRNKPCTSLTVTDCSFLPQKSFLSYCTPLDAHNPSTVSNINLYFRLLQSRRDEFFSGSYVNDEIMLLLLFSTLFFFLPVQWTCCLARTMITWLALSMPVHGSPIVSSSSIKQPQSSGWLFCCSGGLHCMQKKRSWCFLSWLLLAMVAAHSIP